MAGVRKKPNKKSGKYQGWFINWQGKQEFFVGSTQSKETLSIARNFENHHRRIRVGDLPPPKASDTPRTFKEVAAEYVCWGTVQGGHGGRPWSPVHVALRTRHLTKFWPKRLNFATLADISLPKVEAVARELLADGKSGKTVQTHVESLKALCLWAKGRGYLDADPLEGFVPLDVTPKTIRRAMTIKEIAMLLHVAPPARRLLYETALCTGFRKGELAALTVADLDAEHCTLSLAAKHCKGRKDSRQPIPAALVTRLKAESEGKPADAPLLAVDFHIDRLFFRDYDAAGISENAPGGTLVFHSLRHTYCTLVIESGANVKEAQTLLRHMDPKLTMNVYSHVGKHRLAATAEAVGDRVISDEKNVPAMQRVAVGAEAVDVKACDELALACVESGKGVGFEPLHPLHY